MTQNDGQEFQTRIDYQLNKKHSVFIRNMELPFKQPAPYGVSGNILATSVAGLDNPWQSPEIVAQFRPGMRSGWSSW